MLVKLCTIQDKRYGASFVSLPAMPGHKSRLAFLILAIAALVAVVGQISLGGVVRVTGSGLGCPDWPLCHGRIIPPFEVATLIEYSHRLSATLVGILVLAAAVTAWRAHRSDPRVVFFSTIAFVLVIAAALLGGVTVVTELDWWFRTLHLGVAESLVACLVVVAVAAWTSPGRTVSTNFRNAGFGVLDLLLVISLIGVFVLILYGSYMVGLGYGSACATWPLCNESIAPEGAPYATHMAHRYMAAVVGGLVVATAVLAWSRRSSRPELGWGALILASLFVAQVLVGAAAVWSGFATGLKAFHLSMATLAWGALAFLAALNFVPKWLPSERRQPVSDTVSSLEGMAQ